MNVKSLHYYPIKSCSGIDLTKAIISNRGFENDRAFMVVDKNNVFLTQRKQARMALIKPSFSKGNIILSAPDISPLSIKIVETGSIENVLVWKDDCLAISQGQETADWLSSFLGVSCKLVKMENSYQRKLDSRFAISENNQIGFADGYPFLLISQGSFDDLNTRLNVPIPMNRFRPNIVIKGCNAYEEDRWRKIKIGDITFELVKPCIRCAITTIDQSTLDTSKEPLATLATYRVSAGGGVMFGQNLIHHNNGLLSLGDNVEVLEVK